MALGFSPLNTKVEGGEIMSDFEIISVVIMIATGAAAQIFDLNRQRFLLSKNSETSGFRPPCIERDQIRSRHQEQEETLKAKPPSSANW